VPCVSATSLYPCAIRRASTSAGISPMSEFTWRTASMSATDAVAMSGSFTVDGNKRGISSLDFLIPLNTVPILCFLRICQTTFKEHPADIRLADQSPCSIRV
jgi:hypothetical protein